MIEKLKTILGYRVATKQQIGSGAVHVNILLESIISFKNLRNYDDC